MRRDELPYKSATGFTYESSNANSVYEGLQVRVIRRFRRGISVNANYTFSKSIDNSSTFGGVGNTVAQNAYDISAERGLSSFDQRHTLNVYGGYRLKPTVNRAWTAGLKHPLQSSSRNDCTLRF